MSLRLKRSLITFLLAFTMIFASLAIFIAPNKASRVNAEVIQVQVEGVADNYVANTQKTFPETITHNGQTYGDGVIIYPNGKVYNIVANKQFVLNALGNYTLRYFGDSNVVEKSFCVSQKHFVLSSSEEPGKNEIVAVTEEMMEGQLLPQGAGKYPEGYAFKQYTNSSDWPNIEQNLTTFGQEALVVRMGAGTTFNYSVPIDLTKAEEDGLTNIIKFQPRYADYDKSREGSSANYNIEVIARNMVITLTDCYDSSRYMKLIVQNGGDTNYARAGTDTLLDAGWVFPTARIPTSDMPYRDFYEGTEYGFAYMGSYGTGTPAGWVNEWARRDGIFFKFDYDDAEVWATSCDKTGINDYKEVRVTDFMNKSVYPTTDYRGFTTGEVYLSIEFTDYQTTDSARVDIYEIAGQKVSDLFEMREKDLSGEPASMARDEKAPIIDLDFTPTISDGVYVDIGSKFVLPSAKAFDVNLKGELKTFAYRNYTDAEHRINVPIVDGKVSIDEQDIYTIVYLAEDAFGNTTEKLIKVFGTDGDPAIDFAYDGTLANLDAGKTYQIPGFTFDTKNIASSRKVKIVISSAKESIVVADLKSEQEIEDFLNNGAEFMLSYAGEYTVEYIYSDNAIQNVASYKVISNPSDAVSFPTKPVLPRTLLRNASYDFEEVWAYSYATGSSQPHGLAQVYIAYDEYVNEENVAASTFTALSSIYNNKIEGSEKAVLKYVYGETVAYSDVAKIVDVNITAPNKLNQYAYFTGNFATAHPDDPTFDAELFPEEIYNPIINNRPAFVSANLDYKSKVMSGDNTLQYANIIDISNFSFYYQIPDDADPRKDADNFNAIKIVLTDPYNPENVVYARVYKIGTDVFLDLNGEYTSRVNATFAGSTDKFFTYNRSLGIFNVSGVSAKMPFTFNFTTTKAYFDIVLEDITGVAGIRIVELNAHKFAHDGRTNVAPAPLMILPQGEYKEGSIVTIYAANFADVLTPIVKDKVSISVTDPNGDYMTALDGTVLDGTCDPYKDYQVELGGMGQYSVSYTATNGLNKKTSPPGFIFVVDLEAPEITLKGGLYEDCVLYLKPGQKYKVKYSVTDNVSLRENLFTRIIWHNRDLCRAWLFFDDIIYFTEEGTYQVSVNSFDEKGNYAKMSFTVVVTNEEVK